MTRHEIAQLACKLFGLWFFCQAVQEFFFTGVEALMEIPSAAPSYLLGHVLLRASTMCCYALMAMLLWRFSKGIASAMVSDDPAPVTAKNLDFRSLLSVAIAAIGVFIAVEAIPAIGKELYLIWQTAQLDVTLAQSPYGTQRESHLLSQVAKLVLALGLIFGSRGIAKMIRRWRSGTPVRPINAKPPQDPGM